MAGKLSPTNPWIVDIKMDGVKDIAAVHWKRHFFPTLEEAEGYRAYFNDYQEKRGGHLSAWPPEYNPRAGKAWERDKLWSEVRALEAEKRDL